MILAWDGNGVCDGGHSADVMKKMGGRARVAEDGALEINCVDIFIVREGVKDLEHESPHSSQKKA